MKRITSQNWLEPDTTGASAGTTPQAWRDAFLAIRLDKGVPGQIAAMYEAARASVIYGCFFAPLVILGVEHCYWVLESGVRARCVQLDLPVTVQDRQGKGHALSFSHNLRQLMDKGMIAEADAELWRQAGELRAWATQPKHGNPLDHDHVVTAFTRAATLLNRLFA